MEGGGKGTGVIPKYFKQPCVWCKFKRLRPHSATWEQFPQCVLDDPESINLHANRSKSHIWCIKTLVPPSLWCRKDRETEKTQLCLERIMRCYPTFPLQVCLGNTAKINNSRLFCEMEALKTKGIILSLQPHKANSPDVWAVSEDIDMMCVCVFVCARLPVYPVTQCWEEGEGKHGDRQDLPNAV